MRWEIMLGNKGEMNECLDCGHKSKNWAEPVASNNREEDDEMEPDGTNKVFCPKCKYYHYYCA